MNATQLKARRERALPPKGHRTFLTVQNGGPDHGRYRWSCFCGVESHFWHRISDVARYYADGHLMAGKRGLHRPVGSMPR